MVTEAFYREMRSRLFVAGRFEKRASNDPTDLNLSNKTSHDVVIWRRVKQAIDFGAVRSALGGASKAVGKGMLYGAAPAATAIGAGALAAPYVIDRAAKAKEQSTKNIIEDIRNKALQTALGVGAIGAGLTGMHHLLAGRREDAARQPAAQDAVNFSDSQGLLPSYGNDRASYYKQGSVEENDLLEKLAAVGYLDVLLEETKAHAKVGEDAKYCRLLNAEHGVHLLRQLMHA